MLFWRLLMIFLTNASIKSDSSPEREENAKMPAIHNIISTRNTFLLLLIFPHHPSSVSSAFPRRAPHAEYRSAPRSTFRLL